MNLKVLKTGEALTIRHAKGNDAENLIRYVKKVADETTFLTFSGVEFNKSVADEIQIIESHTRSENEIFLLGLIQDEIVGMVNVQSSKKKRLRHAGDLGISVMKQYWGKGIGSLLMKAAIEWAQQTDIIKRIGLTVSANNETGIHLYKKHGFEIEGVLRKDICIDGLYLDSYVMSLLIN